MDTILIKAEIFCFSLIVLRRPYLHLYNCYWYFYTSILWHYHSTCLESSHIYNYTGVHNDSSDILWNSWNPWNLARTLKKINETVNHPMILYSCMIHEWFMNWKLKLTHWMPLKQCIDKLNTCMTLHVK